MLRRDFLLSAGASGAAVLGLAPRAAQAARLTSQKVLERPTLYRNRPDWPVPSDPGQVLYLQRSINRNTIVFALRYTTDGALHRETPVDVFWRRYEEDGARRALKPIERMLAFGVDVTPRPDPGQYSVAVRGLPQLAMLLQQTGPGRSQLWARIGGRTAEPVYAFAEVIDGLIPRVTGLWVHGRLPRSGQTISEFYSVEGGEVRP